MPVSFTRLRIAGFKSFAEPVMVELLPGLTGVVGPNGCGKSNVVEALRWAMGENSARSLRGGEMDDVIFAGTAHRASRNLAEVTLTLEDALGLAPPPLDQEPELQISRRIERGAGSNYRINGKEARARDVQTLFADLASGARSCAMVSQGRIGSLVNARPDERRAILEEAAGITGLHARRHEAELKLRAAEANLSRAEDLKGQLDIQQEGLKKQARQAARYRNISGLVRQAEAEWLSLLRTRAETAFAVAKAAFDDALVAVQMAEAEATEAATRGEAAELALPEPRAVEAQARSLLERRRVEDEGLEQEEARAREALAAAEGRRDQLHVDLTDATAAHTDAEDATNRLQAEAAQLVSDQETLPARIEAAETALVQATDFTAEAAAEADRATETAAQAAAQGSQAQSALSMAEERARRLEAQTARLTSERDAAEAGRIAPEMLEAARTEQAAADAALIASQDALETAEQARAAGLAVQAEARRLLDTAQAAHAAGTATRTGATDRAGRIAAQRDTLQAEHDQADSARIDPEHLVNADSARDSAESALAEAQAALEQAGQIRAEAAENQARAQRELVDLEAAHARAGQFLQEAATRATRIRAEHETVAAELAGIEQAQLPAAQLDAARDVTAQAAEALSARRQAQDAAEADRVAAAERHAGAARARQNAETNRAQAESDLAAAEARRVRLTEQHAAIAAEHAEAERAQVPQADRDAANAALRAAEQALEDAGARLARAETAREQAAQALTQATNAAVQAETAAARLNAEIDGLRDSLRDQDTDGTPVGDLLDVPGGLEAAVGAGLGEALASAREAEAARHWRDLPALAEDPLPGGAQPLSQIVAAPAELARALSRIGLLPDGADGDQLQAALRPGQSLVARNGAAWRWDGHVVRADATSAAAARLERRNRLQQAEQAAPRLADAAEAAGKAREQAAMQDRAAQTEETDARAARAALDAPLQQARTNAAALQARHDDALRTLAGIAAQLDRLASEQRDADATHRQIAERRDAIPEDAELAQAADDASNAEQAALGAESAARDARQAAEAALQAARETESRLSAQAAEAESRLAALRPQVQRLADERDEADRGLKAARFAQSALAAIPDVQAQAQQAEAADREAAAADAQAREARRMADHRLTESRTRHAALATQAAEAETRLAALRPQLDRLHQEHEAAQAAVQQAQADLAALPNLDALELALLQADEDCSTALAAAETGREARRAAEQRGAAAQSALARLATQSAEAEARLAALTPQIDHLLAEQTDAESARATAQAALDALPDLPAMRATVDAARVMLADAQRLQAESRNTLETLRGDGVRLAAREQALQADRALWTGRRDTAAARVQALTARVQEADAECGALGAQPDGAAERRQASAARLAQAEAEHAEAAAALHAAERAARDGSESRRSADTIFASAREAQARTDGAVAQAQAALDALAERITERLGENAELPKPGELTDVAEDRARRKLDRLGRERDEMGPVNLRAELELEELENRLEAIERDRTELETAIAKLRGSIGHLNREGRERLQAVFQQVDRHFQQLFTRMFGGGRAHLGLVGSDDPLQAGLEIYAQPPGKKLATLSLLSGGEQALTALSLIFATFRCNPAPICVLDEVDAPLDDANVERFCALLNDMVQETGTRFLVVTHHQLTMSRMDRLYGVTMQERGVSRLLSVDLASASEMVEPRVAAE